MIEPPWDICGLMYRLHEQNPTPKALNRLDFRHVGPNDRQRFEPVASRDHPRGLAACRSTADATRGRPATCAAQSTSG